MTDQWFPWETNEDSEAPIDLRHALEAARYELTTLHGLYALDRAIDSPDAIYIDTNAAVQLIDAALKDLDGQGAAQ